MLWEHCEEKMQQCVVCLCEIGTVVITGINSDGPVLRYALCPLGLCPALCLEERTSVVASGRKTLLTRKLTIPVLS